MSAKCSNHNRSHSRQNSGGTTHTELENKIMMALNNLKDVYQHLRLLRDHNWSTDTLASVLDQLREKRLRRPVYSKS
ncbi:hypothetical protein VIM7927_01943 [Vibrio mangrovi]|uniref:Uncharacterized protein n=1 Tax=Vibrio mangrovi TaxID=474394 RepID=A0A1Y6ISQ7_9VIBR|nr:hypothetical protein VIM7927_01943 [Vibrio mangrovi]